MKRPVFFLLVFAAAMLLKACTAPSPATDSRASGSQTIAGMTVVSSPTLTPQPPSPTATPSPTLDDQSFWATWLASRPRNMEAYGLVYDPSATAELPPRTSVSMPIWSDRLPLQVLNHPPSFIDTLPFRPPPDTDAALARAGCVRHFTELDCSSESPLLDFGCDWLVPANGSYPSLSGDQQVIGVCHKTLADENETRENYLYRTGCAFRSDAWLILDRDGEYSLINTPAQVKDLLLPIDSPEKALTYLELMTGLSATYSFEIDPMLLYFLDPLEGTRVEENGGVYQVNLFHYVQCLCEPWVNSLVHLQVDREGRITWLDALPISMTIGFSCAD